MAPHGEFHRLAVLIPALRASLDIGEQERNGAARSHAVGFARAFLHSARFEPRAANGGVLQEANAAAAR
jgi:hypothetical protein